MFDLDIKKPDSLYSKVVEVSERVVLESCAESSRSILNLCSPLPVRCVTGVTGETVQIIEELGTGPSYLLPKYARKLTFGDVPAIRASLKEIGDEGYKSLAVCLMHSYTFPDHENKILELAKETGFEQVSLSHKVSQRTKIVPRGNSATVDAYLTPAIERYLTKFSENFADVEASMSKIEFMQSDGGLVPSRK